MSSDVTVIPYLLKRKIRSDGKTPIFIRITKNRKYRFKTTGIYILEKDWNPNGTVRKSNPRYKALNAEIEEIVYKTIKSIRDLDNSEKSLKNIKKSLEFRENDNFFNYAKIVVDELERDQNLHEWKHLKTTIKKLRQFTGSSLLLTDVDSILLEDFKRFLKHTIGNSINTIAKELQRLRRITKKANKEGLLKIDPYLNLDRVKLTPTSKTRLSLEQIQSINELDLKEKPFQDVSRDVFIFSFYNAGIRIGDACRLKWSHIIDGRLRYNMAKTGKGKNIKLLPGALKILAKYELLRQSKEDYIFPLLNKSFQELGELELKRKISSKTAQINKTLKVIAKLAGIEDTLSTHVARHSFADHARKMNMNLYDISNALGHSDTRTTERYLSSFDEVSLDEGMSKLFKGVM